MSTRGEGYPGQGYDNAVFESAPERTSISAEKSPTGDADISDYGATSDTDPNQLHNTTAVGGLTPTSLSQSQNSSFGLQTLEEREEEHPCSWEFFSPLACQKCRNPKVVLVCLCIAAAIQGMVVNGFINVSISSLEQRYDLSSTESGVIVSTYDIASVVCLLPVSYFGGIGRKPHWLGIGMGVLALGSFVFALPQFTTADYKYGVARSDSLCYFSSDNTTEECGSADTDGLSDYQYVFIFANFLHGAGAAPLYTLGVTYLDENLSTAASPFYLGIFYMMSIVGPAVGYLLGGQFLNIYCDFNTVGSPGDTLDTDNPNWVGAWWIGFLLSACLAVLIAIPLCGFPKDLPGSKKLRAQKVSEAYKGSDTATSNPEFGQSFKDIPASLKILLSNPTFVCLNLAAASEGMIVAGFSAFAPKFIEAQFSLTSGWAATLVGCVAIPAGGGGMFIGGYLTQKLKLNFTGMIKLCLCTVTIALLCCLCFLSRCENVDFAGVNVHYELHNQTLDKSNLTATCNDQCHCLRNWYEPVCSQDTMYYSPCHAGCVNSSIIHGTKVFFDCSCLESSIVTSDDKHSYPAVEGTCDSGCSEQLTVYLIVFAVALLATFITSMPALSATLRCVPDKQRSFALGIQWILARCLGTIPAPILFGALIDKSCLLWEENCGDRGSCYFYDNFDQSLFLMVLALSFKGLSLTFFVLSLCVYRPPEIVDDVLPELSSASSTQHILEQMNGPMKPLPAYQTGLSNPGLDKEGTT